MRQRSRRARLVAVIPAYNESKTIPLVLAELQKAGLNRVYVIDDGSVDDTRNVAAQCGAHVVKNTQNRGAGISVRRGLQIASRFGYNTTILLDADGQHDSRYIPKLVAEIARGADYVIASRYIDKAPMTTSRLRAFGTKIISVWLWLWFGKRIYDPTSGYRALSPKTHRFFSRHYPTFFPEPEAVICALEQGLAVKEIPSVMKPRLYGVSSISPYKSVILMTYIFASIPYRAVRRFFRNVLASGR